MSNRKKKNSKKTTPVSEDYLYYLKVKEEYLKRAKDKEEYGVKQVDAMLVALSTAGLGFTLNYLKGVEVYDFTLIANISQLMFLTCLVLYALRARIFQTGKFRGDKSSRI